MNDTDSCQRFTLWAVDRLRLEVAPAESGVMVLTVPQKDREAFEGEEKVRFTFEKETYDRATPESPIELITPGGRLLGWLVEQVRTLGNVTHAVPRQEPAGVHDMAGKILSAYTVDGGSVHFAGFTLEPRPVLKVTYRLRLEGLEPHDELLEVHAAGGDQSLAPEVAAALHLDELDATAPPPKIAREDLDRLVQQAAALADERRKLSETNLAESLLPKKLAEVRQLEDYFDKTKTETQSQHSGNLAAEEKAALDEQVAALEDQKKRRLAAIEDRYSVAGHVELVAAILIWCKAAAGKLRFSIGNSSADAPFAAWAGLLQPPPFICPYTGRPTFHVAATDDGRIAAAEEIGQCEVTDRRVLKHELVKDAATGKTVLKELTDLCSVSGLPVLKDRFVTCPICHVHVSPHILRGEQCRACPPAHTILKDDPRLARVLGEYPGLDPWRNWKLAESPAAYLFTASGLWRQLFIVLDKRSLEPLRIAGKNRLGATWTDLPTTGYDEVLR